MLQEIKCQEDEHILFRWLLTIVSELILKNKKLKKNYSDIGPLCLDRIK